MLRACSGFAGATAGVHLQVLLNAGGCRIRNIRIAGQTQLRQPRCMRLRCSTCASCALGVEHATRRAARAHPKICAKVSSTCAEHQECHGTLAITSKRYRVAILCHTCLCVKLSGHSSRVLLLVILSIHSSAAEAALSEQVPDLVICRC